MTDNTQPEALIDLIDAYAETRHRYGGIYNARTEAARNAVIEDLREALSGVQALSAAPVAFLKSVIALCSHRGYSPANIEVWDKDDKWIADLWRQAESMLTTSPTPPAEQKATKETSGGFHVWRDISTAPKDGSRFVATGHNYGLYGEVRHTCVAQWFQGCWMEASDWNETSELKYLTHWMPLPSPPDDVAAPAEQQAAPKAAPVEQDDHQILAITTAYEQGVGKGHQAYNSGKEIANPYSPAYRCDLAWQYGYKEGKEQAQRATKAAPQQEAQEPATVPYQKLTDETDLILSDPDTELSIGAKRALLWVRTWVSVPLWTTPQPAPVVGRMSPSKEWLETRLAIADDSDVQAGVPSKNARPCDAPPGCDSHNCHGCDDFKHPSPTPQPAPDCHHRPPCDECAALAAQGGE